MKINELLNESPYDTDPKLMPYVRMGQMIASALETSSGIKWEDEEFNKAAALGNHPANVATAVDPAAKSIMSLPTFTSMFLSMMLGLSC